MELPSNLAGVHKVRPLRIGAFAVRDHVAVVADEVLPIAVEVDTGTGEVIAAHAWTLSAAHRGKPAAASVALTPTEVVGLPQRREDWSASTGVRAWPRCLRCPGHRDGCALAR